MSVKVPNRKILEFQTFRVWKLMNVKKIDKFINFWNCKIEKKSEIVQFRKLSNFQVWKITKTIKIRKTSNLVNYHICILNARIILKNVKIKNKLKNGEIE